MIREAELRERLGEAAGVGMELERELPLRAWLFAIVNKSETENDENRTKRVMWCCWCCTT